MADANQYFVMPSGEVRIVKPEFIEEVLARGLTPATEEQRRQYDAVKAAKAEPLGAVKAFGQSLAEGAVSLAGIPAALMTTVPSVSELTEKISGYVPESIKQAAIEQFGEAGAAEEAKRGGIELPSAADVARGKRMELAGEMARYTTLPGLQQEMGLRTAEQIKAEREAFPKASTAGTIASFFVGPAASKIVQSAAVKAVPALAAEATLAAESGLTSAISRATGLEAKQAAQAAAQAELTAAQATGDAVQIAAKQTALTEASAAAQAAADNASKLRIALAAESGEIPEELASLATKDVVAAGKAARKASERMSADAARTALDSLKPGQRRLADNIKSLERLTLTSPAITSKVGTEVADAVEKRALTQIERAPGFSTKLAEANVALARAADDAAVGEAKAVTAAQLAKAEESLATLKTRQELAAKAIGLGLGRSAEMMMFGLQGVANEAALGDPALVAESAYGTLGFDGALGAGLGVAEALVPAGLRGSLRAARRGGQRLAKALAPIYDELAASVTGADVETVRAVRAAGEDLDRKGLRRVIEEAVPVPAAPTMPPEIVPPTVPPPVPKPVMPPQVVMPPPVPKPVMPPRVQRPTMPGIPEVTAPALKPVDYENAAKELRTALQDDVRQIAAPKPGGLLFDANTQWRKVQIADTIRNRVQQQKDELVKALYESKMGEPLTFADEAFLSQIESGEFTNTPYRQSLKDLIGRVRSARNVAKTTGMTGEMVPTAQEAAYKVNAHLANLEDRLSAFEASNPNPEQIYQELKHIDQELFFKRKAGAPTGEQLSLLNRQMNAAYADLKSYFKGVVLNKELWGDAAALESAWKEDARAYYAGLKNLKKAAPGLIRETVDPATGLVTEIVIDSKKLKSIVKNINTDAMTDFRNAAKQYFDGRRRVIGRIHEVADYVKANVDKGAVADRMAATERAYDRAIENAVNDASNVAMEDAGLAAAGYSKQQIKDIRARLSEEFAAAKEARKGKIEEITLEIKQAVEARKQAIAAAREARAAEVEEIKLGAAEARTARQEAIDEAKAAYKDQVKARDELVASLQSEYKTATSERQKYITEQINLLNSSAKAGMLKAGLRAAVKYGGPVAGGLFAGPVGVILGGATTAVSSPVATAKALAKLNKAMMQASDVASGVSNTLSGSSTAAVRGAEALASFASNKDLRARYKEVEKRTRQLASDMDAREDQEEAMLFDVMDHAPNVTTAAKNVNAVAIQYLENARPKPPPNLAPMQLMAWEPVEAEQRKFLRVQEAVSQPLETLQLAQKGALLPEQLDALNAVYPALMSEVRSKLLERIEHTNTVPAKHRRMVSMLLGQNVDSAPALGVTAQSVYGNAQQPPPQKQQQMPVSRAKTLRVAERSAEYDTNARQNAQLGARRGYGP